METVLSRCEAPLRLAAGSTDPMVGPDAMRRIDPDAVLIEGAGHNAHWESPDAVWRLLGLTRQPGRETPVPPLSPASPCT